MEGIGILIVGGIATVIVGLVAYVIVLRQHATRLRETLARTEGEKLALAARLKPALDVEAGTASLRGALEKERGEAEHQRARLKAESDQLRARYAQGLTT